MGGNISVFGCRFVLGEAFWEASSGFKELGLKVLSVGRFFFPTPSYGYEEWDQKTHNTLVEEALLSPTSKD